MQLIKRLWLHAPQTIVGVKTLVFQLAGDSIVGEDRNYLFPTDLQYPVTYLILTANVLLPLYYPSYNPQVQPATWSLKSGPMAAHQPADMHVIADH